MFEPLIWPFFRLIRLFPLSPFCRVAQSPRRAKGGRAAKAEAMMEERKRVLEGTGRKGVIRMEREAEGTGRKGGFGGNKGKREKGDPEGMGRKMVIREEREEWEGKR